MIQRSKKAAAIVLAAALFAECPVQTIWADTTGSWYEDLELNETYELDTLQASEGGYISSPAGEAVEAVDDSHGLLKASAVPSAYMNDLDEVTSTYPGTRDQGLYGTCWAFSAVGLAEFDMIADDGLVDTGVDYSELQLSYLTYNHVTDSFGGTEGDTTTLLSGNDYLNVGGSLELAARTLLQWEGLALESLIPYTSASTSLTLDYDDAYLNNTVHLQNVSIISIRENSDAVKEAIMEHGAVGISYYEAETEREYYSYHAAATYDGQTVPTVYCNNPRVEANHAVNIVGWDDDFPASNFKQTPAGNGAWLVRNSWSDTTGYDINGYSYFWLSYYDASLEDAAWVYDFETADNYDYNYQYDGDIVCWDAFAENGYDFSTVANIYKVSGEANEQLEAVSISLMYADSVPYTIKIYANLRSSVTPTSGYLADTITGTTSYAGVYTIPLNEPVTLAKGTKYAIVVELGTSSTQVDMEYAYTDSVFSMTAGILSRQSFVFYDGVWEDAADLSADFGTGNFCIKGYTSSLGGSKIAKVTGLVKKKSTKTTVTLNWNKVSGVDGYEIYRSTKKNGTYEKVATVTSGTTTYKDTGLKKGSTYYYRVRAYKDNSDEVTTVGAMSAVVGAKTKKK